MVRKSRDRFSTDVAYLLVLSLSSYQRELIAQDRNKMTVVAYCLISGMSPLD